MFARMFYASCIAGLLCGMLLTAIQAASVVPIIIEAESYEAPEAPTASETQAKVHVHDDGHSHDHGDGWAPEDGFERTFWTTLSNVGTAIGFSLLLVGILAWRNTVSLPQGLLWGGVGFAVFFAGPALGLTPEIPGAVAADIVDRQIWWIGTAVATGIGLGLIITIPNVSLKIAGAVLLAVPHLIGAPHPEVTGGAAPQELADRFVMASTITNAIFWLALGLASAGAYLLLNRNKSDESTT